MSEDVKKCPEVWGGGGDDTLHIWGYRRCSVYFCDIRFFVHVSGIAKGFNMDALCPRKLGLSREVCVCVGGGVCNVHAGRGEAFRKLQLFLKETVSRNLCTSVFSFKEPT